MVSSRFPSETCQERDGLEAERVYRLLIASCPALAGGGIRGFLPRCRLRRRFLEARIGLVEFVRLVVEVARDGACDRLRGCTDGHALALLDFVNLLLQVPASAFDVA